MNSKERVLAALEGRIPDRVPWGEFAVDFDTVERIIGHETYFRAKARSQIAFWEGRHDEVAESYRRDHIELHRRLDLDIVTFPMATWEIPPEGDDSPPRRVDDSTWEDKYGRIFKHSAVTEDITCVRDPVEEARTFSLDDFSGEPKAPERESRSWAVLESVIDALKDEKFICGPSGGIAGLVLPGGLEKASHFLVERPELIEAATARVRREQDLADPVRIHPASDAVLVASDFGYKTGPFVGPEMFRRYFLEANCARVSKIRRDFGKKVILHSCGNVNSYLDFFVEIGIDGLQSIQQSAGMDLCRLKKSHGERFALWGGVSLEELTAGTPNEVRRDVRRAMACAKKGGRFILGTSHSIAVGSRYENVMAMIDEYHKRAGY